MASKPWPISAAKDNMLVRPAAIRVEGGVKVSTGGGRKRAQPATYINYTDADAAFAQKLRPAVLGIVQVVGVVDHPAPIGVVVVYTHGYMACVRHC